MRFPQLGCMCIVRLDKDISTLRVSVASVLLVSIVAIDTVVVVVLLSTVCVGVDVVDCVDGSRYLSVEIVWLNVWD